MRTVVHDGEAAPRYTRVLRTSSDRPAEPDWGDVLLDHTGTAPLRPPVLLFKPKRHVTTVRIDVGPLDPQDLYLFPEWLYGIYLLSAFHAHSANELAYWGGWRSLAWSGFWSPGFHLENFGYRWSWRVFRCWGRTPVDGVMPSCISCSHRGVLVPTGVIVKQVWPPHVSATEWSSTGSFPETKKIPAHALLLPSLYRVSKQTSALCTLLISAIPL